MSETSMSPKNSKYKIGYEFYDISACNMCGTDARHSRVMGTRLSGSQGRSPGSVRGIAVTVCKCVNCSLIYADPMPVPRKISDHYGVPPEEYWTNVDYDPSPGYFDRQIDAAKRLLDFRPGMAVIDVGLGLGKGARVMRDAGFDVHGMEPSMPFYTKALELLGPDPSRFQCASLEEANFEPNAFSFVTFGAVLEHLYDPSAALSKALQWLRPGGLIHAEVPNSKHMMAKLFNAYFRLSGTNYVTNISPMHRPFHLYEFSLKSFAENGKTAGYSVAEHWIDVAGIYHAPRFVRPALRWLMSQNGTGMQLTVWLRKPEASS